MTSGVSSSTETLDRPLAARAAELLADDQVVVANSRWRRARLVLEATGGSAQTIVVDRGVVTAADLSDAADLPEIRIRGSAEQWQPILRGRHGGLHRAWRHRQLEFTGDPVATFDLWKTIWRLGEALAIAARERRDAV